MAKLELQNVTNLSGAEQSAVSRLNSNNEAIEQAFENTLSRDGTSPNQMGVDLDLNNNDLLNVNSLQVETVTIAGENINSFVTRAETAAENAEESETNAALSEDNAAESANAAQGFANSVFTFDTLSDAENTNIPVVIDSFETRGYASIGDGGKALYKRVATPSPAEAWHVQSADGAWWELVVEGQTIDARVLGAITSATDNEVAINAAIGRLGGVGTVFLPELYEISDSVLIPDGACLTLAGVRGSSGIKRADATAQFIMIFHDLPVVTKSVSLVDIVIDGNYGNGLGNSSDTDATVPSAIQLNGDSTSNIPDCGNFRMSGCLMKNVSTFGMGTLVAGYKDHHIIDNDFENIGSATDSDNALLYHAIYLRRFENCTIIGNRCNGVFNGNFIKVQGAGARTSSYIAGNKGRNLAGRGIYAADGGNVTICGNESDGCVTYGIVVTADVSTPPFDNIIITGNIVKNVSSAVGEGILVNTCRNVTVKENQLLNFGLYGVHIRGCSFVQAGGNNFWLEGNANQQTTAPIYVYLSQSGSQNLDVLIGRDVVRFTGGSTITTATYLTTTGTGGRVSYIDPVRSQGGGGTLTLYNLDPDITHTNLT